MKFATTVWFQKYFHFGYGFTVSDPFSLRDNYFYFSTKTYAVGTHWNRLNEVILMSTHNICFYVEMCKIIPK